MFEYSGYSVNYEYREIMLEHFSDLGEIISYKRNALIEFEGSRMNHIYLITEGRVKQFFTNANGLEKTILILSRGDMFGEVTMIQKDCDHCITETYCPTKVCKISRDVFEDYLKKNPDLYNSVMLMLTTKFRLLMYQIFDSNYLTTKEKLYALLQRLSIQHEKKKDEGKEIDLYLTHEEIARMIGSTRSTVTRLMRELEEEKKIQRNGKRLIVSDNRF